MARMSEASLSVRPTGQVLLPLAAMIAAMIAFQGGAAWAKQLFAAVGPLGAATLRLALGGLMLMAIVRPWRAWPSRAALVPAVGLGVCMSGGVSFFFLAIERIPLGVAVTVQFLGPLGVAVFGSRRPIDLVWAALAGAGVWSLAGAKDVSGPLDRLGLVYVLCAGAAWAGYILLGQAAARQGTTGRTIAAIATTVAALVLAPFGLATAGTAMFDPSLLPLALGIALLTTVLTFTLELWSMARLPARTFSVFASLEPAFAALSGFLFLGERLSALQLTGMALVMAAAAGAAAGARRADQPPHP